VKRYLFLSVGFQKPTPEIMGAWEAWMRSISSTITDQGGLWGGGRELTDSGVEELPLGTESITGFIIFNAESLDDAEKIARDCPVISSNRVYEIVTK